jgi:hypothetical protein
MKSAWLYVAFLAIFYFSPRETRAATCDWNIDGSFFSCDNYGMRQSTGRSLPRALDVIRINPASIPSLPTPIGVEGTYANSTELGKNKFQASLVKGFKGIGLGLGTWDVGSFSGADLGEQFANTIYQTDYEKYQHDASAIKGFRVGASLMAPLNPLEKIFHLQMGASVGKATGSSVLSPSYGIVADARWISFGYTLANETLSGTLPRVKTQAWSAGLQIQQLYFGVTGSFFRTAAGGFRNTVYNVRWARGALGLYGAVKKFRDRDGKPFSQNMASFDLKLNRNLLFGYAYGLYHYSHSATLAFFF